ncbi:uncharacterized protein BYT42DRAFT_614255 [Radiomyces spectabilis]|uniref:uncharacterized protein n=1 Tax=Radiomyces spectabilis TaxID=64574 RepID=UPI0022200E95|nr:uncharacterized protein BYT42DRAFT_614255 [Radiomyces spectabilis]KAI8377582.1 hypothetical protein BYT42DRAFT_614255 [Radiomyces spectabilis]
MLKKSPASNDPANLPEWPSSIERSDLLNSAIDDIRQLFENVPKPINVKTLSAHPEKYLPFLHAILRETENYNAEQINSVEVVQTEAKQRMGADSHHDSR